VTNALAYHDTEFITIVKFVYSTGPGANLIKLFTAVIYEFS
jgi:hypothetical protein